MRFVNMRCEIQDPYFVGKWNPINKKPKGNCKDRKYLVTVGNHWELTTIVTTYRKGEFVVPSKIFKDDDEDDPWVAIGWAYMPSPCHKEELDESLVYKFKV